MYYAFCMVKWILQEFGIEGKFSYSKFQNKLLNGKIMKNNFKWHKEQIGGKWYSVCDHKHVPMIEHTKDGKYKLRNANGKAVLHEDFGNAVKLALEVYEKFKKFNKSFEEQIFEKV